MPRPSQHHFFSIDVYILNIEANNFFSYSCTSSEYNCRNYYSSYRRIVETIQRYNTSEIFVLATSTRDHLSYYPSNRIEGSSIVAYNGYLFYIQYGTRILVKFDTAGNTTASTRSLPTEIGVQGDIYQYTSGGRSSIDLEVDESGLWMIYSTTGSQGLIVFSRLNATTLEIGSTWYGNFPKKHLGNCFIVCGTLYCVSSHDSHTAKVNYFYDTNTNEEGFMNVSFDSKYGEISSLNYNPYDQKLHAMDNAHAVVYDLIFE